MHTQYLNEHIAICVCLCLFNVYVFLRVSVTMIAISAMGFDSRMIGEDAE